MKLQNKYWGSLASIILAIPSLFVINYIGLMFFITSPSKRCDTGCFPFYALIMVFGGLAYYFRKKRKFSFSNNNVSSKLKMAIEIILTIIAFLFIVTLPTATESTLLFYSNIIAYIWFTVAYIVLSTGKVEDGNRV